MIISMRVYVIGDYSKYHAGCQAVTKVLRQKISEKAEIRYSPYSLPIEVDLSGLKECDALVVNGEGSIHHDSLRAEHIFSWLSEAQSLGLKTYLVNTVWEAVTINQLRLDVLKNLNGLSVRELMSHEALLETTGIRSDVCLDLSYYHPINNGDFTNFFGRMVVGDFLETKPAPPEAIYGYEHFLPLQNHDWEYIVRSLMTASLYITGRHHGVYAACKAKVPFATCAGNSHKVRGLMKWAKVDIPVAEDPSGLPEVVQWAQNNPDAYKTLFEWMDSQAEWTFQP